MKKTCSKRLSLICQKLYARLGFTLIELLVAISITTILFTIGIVQYMKFNRQQIMTQAVEELKTNLRLAQNKALVGERDCTGTFDGYRMTFSSNSYSFQSECNTSGTNYGPSTTVSLPGSILIDSHPDSLLFRILGLGIIIEGSPTIVLRGYGLEETITVTETGEIR